MALKQIKELKVGDKFQFKNACFMKGVYQKKSKSNNDYCLIGLANLPGDNFLTSDKSFVNPL